MPIFEENTDASIDFLEWLMDGSRMSPIIAQMEYAACRDALITESINT